MHKIHQFHISHLLNLHSFFHAVLKALDQLIDDLTLALRTADFQRSHRHIDGLFSDFSLLEKEADLRAITMTDNDIPAFFNHFHDMFRGFVSSKVLILNRLMGLIFDEGVTADSDDCNFFCHCYYFPVLFRI